MDSIFTCPCCKSDVVISNNFVVCNKCGNRHSVSKGIYDFIIPAETKNESLYQKLRIKNQQETKQAIHIDKFINRGFLQYKILLFLNFLLIAFIFIEFYIGIIGIVIVQFADWVYFRLKRAKHLKQWKRSDLIAQTPEDFAAIDRLNLKKDKGAMHVALDIKKGETQDDFDSWKADSRYRLCSKEYSLAISKCNDSAFVGEVGAGDGIMNYKFGYGKNKVFYAIDLSYRELEHLVNKCKDAVAVRAFGEHLPFHDVFFDILLCTETLEHFPLPKSGVKEFDRVLKKGGYLIISVPNATYLRNFNVFHMMVECFLGQYLNNLPQRIVVHENMWCNAVTHHHDFTTNDFKDIINGTDLQIIKSYTANFPFPYAGVLRTPWLFEAIENTVKKVPIIKYWGRNLVLVLQKQ